MLLLPPSVAKREPESSDLSSSDLSNIIDLYEDDLPASAVLDDSPSKAMRETDRDFSPEHLPTSALCLSPVLNVSAPLVGLCI